MTKSFLKNLFLALILLSIPLAGVFAARDDGVYTYIFHLYFDNGKLLADRDFTIPFELIAQKYEVPIQALYSYSGEILSVTNKKLADFPLFLPVKGKGKFTVQAPYFDNAKIVNFYDSKAQKILSFDLAPSGPVCNEDSQCNADTGETYLNCSSDCSASISPSATPSITPMVIPGFNLNHFLASPVFIILVLILVVIFLWLFFKKRNRGLPPPDISTLASPPSPPV